MYATYYLIPGVVHWRACSSYSCCDTNLRRCVPQPGIPPRRRIHKDCRHIEKKSSSYNYVQRFLRSRVLLQHRHAVYIDTDVHDTLWRVVRACGVRNITLSSYVDAIVREHLERYRTQIEALHAPADENSRTRCSS